MSLNHALLHQRPRYPGLVNANLKSKMVCWFDASKVTGINDGDKVAQWNDLSGNALHAVQANATYQPVYKTNILNGLPALQFGSADGVKLVIPSTPLSVFSLYIVLKKITRAVAYPVIFEQDNINTGITFHYNSSNSVFRYVSSDIFGSPFNDNTSYFISFLAGVNQTNAWLNETHQGTNINTQGATTRTKTFTLGESNNNTNRFYGYIMEILLFSVIHDESSRKKYEGYLKNKWGF